MNSCPSLLMSFTYLRYYRPLDNPFALCALFIIVVDPDSHPDPHHFGNLDPHPHQSNKLDPEQDPHHFCRRQAKTYGI
jgi:hypothetical protein